jgi:Mannosyltransferase (PIG-V)
MTTEQFNMRHFPSPAFRGAFGSFLVSRLLVLGAAWLGLASLPRFYHKGPLTEFALGWDGAWYAGIAQTGYFVPPPPGISNLAFPPEMPALVRLLGSLFSTIGLTFDDPDYGNLAVAGLIISNIAFLAALYLLWQLVTANHPQAVANRTLWLIAAFPAGVFWSALYTESLFLLLTVGCILAARRGLWLPAGVLGALAVLTRWVGIILVAVLIIEWLAARKATKSNIDSATTQQNGKAPGWLDLAYTGLIPLCLGLYALYVQLVFGNFMLVLQARSQLGQSFSFFPLTYARGVSLLWQTLTQTGPDRDVVLTLGYGNSLYMWLDLSLPILFTILGLVGWKKGWLLPGDLAWLALGILFPLSTGTTFSLTRYLMPLWPAAIVMSRLGTQRPLLGRAWLGASAALLVICTYLFANEKWIG